jgi:tetratricopeptide (TPR) repeat protein
VKSIAALCGSLVLVVSCTSGSQPQQAAAPASAEQDSNSLPLVALPDLSRMEPSVQQQMRERSQALASKVERPGTPSIELAEAYGEVGNLLLAAEYTEAAEAYYLHAQALAPSDMRWPYYLGHVFRLRGDLAKSAAAFERALRLQPNDVAALVWLGNVRLDEGQPDVASSLFAQALSLQPRLVAALFGAGRTALARRDYSRAVDQLEQALAADPRASMIHYPLGLAYRGLGDTRKAEAHLRQRGTVEISPPDPLMVALRGLLHGAVNEEDQGVRALESGDFASAAVHFRKGLALEPDNPSLRHKLGTALSLSGDTRGALAEFQETIRRSPGYAQAHYSLGVLIAGSGRPQDALQHFLTAVRLDPEFPQARYGYALALAQAKRYEEARKQLAEGAARFPDHREFADALARLQ